MDFAQGLLCDTSWTFVSGLQNNKLRVLKRHETPRTISMGDKDVLTVGMAKNGAVTDVSIEIKTQEATKKIPFFASEYIESLVRDPPFGIENEWKLLYTLAVTICVRLNLDNVDNVCKRVADFCYTFDCMNVFYYTDATIATDGLDPGQVKELAYLQLFVCMCDPRFFNGLVPHKEGENNKTIKINALDDTQQQELLEHMKTLPKPAFLEDYQALFPALKLVPQNIDEIAYRFLGALKQKGQQVRSADEDGSLGELWCLCSFVARYPVTVVGEST